jgi:hypothetical protein
VITSPVAINWCVRAHDLRHIKSIRGVVQGAAGAFGWRTHRHLQHLAAQPVHLLFVHFTTLVVAAMRPRHAKTHDNHMPGMAW